MAWLAFLTGSLSVLIFCVLLKLYRRTIRFYHKINYKPESPENVEPTVNDKLVINRTYELLSDNTSWVKNYHGHCIFGEGLTLYCALALAAKEKTGIFKPDAAYRQLVLSAILQNYPERYRYLDCPAGYWIDPLQKFNNHPDTQYIDVINLLNNLNNQLTKN